MSASSRESYFSILKAAFGGLSAHSDSFIADAFGRYFATAGLLELKSQGDSAPKIDDVSILPQRNELFRLQADLTGNSPPVSRPAAVIANEFLDIMLRRKMVPSALEIELMARALYCEQVHAMRDAGGGKMKFVGVAVDPTLMKVHDDAREVHFGWDYWHPTQSKSSTYLAKFHVAPSSGRGQDAQFANSLGKLIANSLSAEGTLLATAAQIDEALGSVRLKHLKRLTVVRLQSAVFGQEAPEFAAPFSLIGNPDVAWALEFEVHGLKSVGTISKVSNGLLSSTNTLIEQFYIDDRDPNCAAQGASFVERHLLMPRETYLAMQGTAVVEGRQVHVLSNNQLAENV
jgi:hypothetical protein